MNWADVVIGTLVPGAALGGVLANGWWAKKGGERASKVETDRVQSVDWQAHVKEIREWTHDRIETMQADLVERDKRIDRLEVEMKDVRDYVEKLKRKYSAAIRYIRRLHLQLVRHVDPADLEAPPEDIASDL